MDVKINRYIVDIYVYKSLDKQGSMYMCQNNRFRSALLVGIDR